MDSSDSNQNYYDNVLNSKLLTNSDLNKRPLNKKKYLVGRMENGITKLSNLDAMTIQPEKKSKYNITVDV